MCHVAKTHEGLPHIKTICQRQHEEPPHIYKPSSRSLSLVWARARPYHEGFPHILIANFAQTVGRHGVVPIVFRQRKSFTDCMTTQPSAHRPRVLKTAELDCTVKKKNGQIHLSINYARSEPFHHIQLSTSMPDELDPPYPAIAHRSPFSSQVLRYSANSAAAHFEASIFALPSFRCSSFSVQLEFVLAASSIFLPSASSSFATLFLASTHLAYCVPFLPLVWPSLLS